MIGAILAGGENKRIPVLKGFLEVDGAPIIERSAGILTKVFDKVLICTNLPERYFCLGLSLIGDIRNERGPMTGILSSLAATAGRSLFIAACDMPFINEDLVRYMKGVYEGRAGDAVDAVIPVFEGRKQPLLGVYAGSAMRAMEKMIDEGQRGLSVMLSGLRVRYVNEDEIRDIDPHGESFVNINTIRDYKRIGGKACPV